VGIFGARGGGDVERVFEDEEGGGEGAGGWDGDGKQLSSSADLMQISNWSTLWILLASILHFKERDQEE